MTYKNATGPVVGYLLKTFPKLSETFILNEMLELERQGLRLHVFSLRRPQDEPQHPAVRQLQAPVTYIPSLLSETSRTEETALIGSQMRWNRIAPAQSQAALQFHLDRPEEKCLNELLQGYYLATQLQVLNISHLHVHFANVPTATAEIAHQLSGIPYSITAHAKDIYLSDPTALDRRIARAEFVLTCTDYNRRHLESISTSKTPIYLSYHGIDLHRFRPEAPQFLGQSSRDRLSQAPATEGATLARQAPLKILSVGRFCEKKGLNYLLDACHHLQQSGIAFHCRLVGYGPLQAQLEAQIQAQGLTDAVTLVGQLTQDQVIQEYRQADVFVLPCQVTADGDRDGIPNVLLEAMAVGLPVISTAISGITELVQSGENGLLVPEKDPGAIAAALTQLAQDPGLRQQLGTVGSGTVHKKFTLGRNVGRVRALLLSALLAQSPTNDSLSTLSPLLEALVR
ncbi:MAG: glycosyltransferase family 4 protein [Leptolyngbya sp. RL_3_1]|nr:glycosyltransferase family 4 protein [Leptolyngbya sp. RL_3_1]